MDILDRGHRFATVHHVDGNVAHVESHYALTQTQAPLQVNQDFELEFYGKGAGIVLGVTAIPRRAVPAALAASRRFTARNQRSGVAGPASPSLRAGPTASRSTTARLVDSNDRSPFDRDWTDWTDWETDPIFPPPTVPPGWGGGGGGGGGGEGGGGTGATLQSAVRIQLFVKGTREPVQTWELPEGFDTYRRSVSFAPQGKPAADAPVFMTTWWRMVVTPLGPDPVMISVHARAMIADVPIRTTPLSVRLVNHLSRVALEALVPRAVVNGAMLSVSLGPEIADLLGIEATVVEEDISPGSSNAQLRSLNITTVSGDEMYAIAMEHYNERAKRFKEANNDGRQVEQIVPFLFESELEKLGGVDSSDVCIRIQAAFTDASVSVHGFDVASLRGELGEVLIAFDHRLETLRPLAFFDVDFSTAVDLLAGIAGIFTEVSTDVNKMIEDHLFDVRREICAYMRGFLERITAQEAWVHSVKFQNNAWQIRHSEDPPIPPPGPTFPRSPGEVGPIEGGGMVTMIARMQRALRPVSDDPPDRKAEVSPGARARPRDLPPGYLTEGQQLDRLDRHESIVVVMMENRSYDHMLGDLVNARPRTSDAYDGPPSELRNASVGGFLHGVPLVHTRDVLVGTAIPVSPRHFFDPVSFQIGDGTETGLSSGDMLGFARDLYSRTDSPQLACTIYGEAELPVHYRLADEFLTCDRWFSAHPGPTQPNRFATLTGSIPELDNFENDDPRIGYLRERTIFDALSAAGIDWRVFESDLSMIRMFDRYRLHDRKVVPLNDEVDGLEATLRKIGALPRVMFIEPNFADIPPLKTADDDHPPADLAHGQAFLSRVCDLLWDTGRFGEVLLVITYDEHGGFYDHMPPPGTPRSNPTRSYPPLINGGPTWLGVRVPTFVVSPYVSAGAVSKTIFDHTSILKTILVHNRDQLSPEVMLSFGERVNQANDLSAVLDLLAPRQAPVPFVRQVTAAPQQPMFKDLAGLRQWRETERSSPTIIQPSTPGVTPRRIIFTERTNPPADGAAEPRDFHAALAKMLRPRGLRWR